MSTETEQVQHTRGLDGIEALRERLRREARRMEDRAEYAADPVYEIAALMWEAFDALAPHEGYTAAEWAENAEYWRKRAAPPELLKALTETRNALESWMEFADSSAPDNPARSGWQWVLDDADAAIAAATTYPRGEES